MIENITSIEILEKRPNELFIKMERGNDSLEVFWKFGKYKTGDLERALKFLKNTLELNIFELENSISGLKISDEVREALKAQLAKTKELKQNVTNFLA